MLIKGSVFALIILTVNAGIPYDQIEIKISDDGTSTFEIEIKNALTTTKNFFASDEAKILAQVGAKIVGFIPYINIVSGILPALQKVLASESDWKEILAKAIPDQTQRALAENDIRNIEAAMQTVSGNIEFLKNGDDFSSESKIAIVHIIHTELDKIVNKFTDERAIFRRYPLISVPPLFLLSSFISVFDPIKNVIVPALARLSHTSCKLSDTLKEYRSIAIRGRLEKVSVVDQLGTAFEIQNNLLELLNRPYNEYGYNQTNSGEIACQSKGCNFDPNFKYRQGCVHDSVDATEYYAGNAVVMYGCVVGYLELVRYRTERAFIDPMYLVGRTCSEAVRNRPRTVTGNGWLTLTIIRVSAHQLIDGSSCDTFDFCDPYVKVSIEGHHVFTTSKKSNAPEATFFETFKTSRVQKTAKITLEMWDDDSGFLGSPDDLMLRADTTIGELLTQDALRHGENTIFISTQWKDEYENY
ncbi:uncharacterized protein LOC119082620 [Bradysia coprophila]|uniref:uncharacterized protein LOC119082620 n=1 Tax=Bradysia coprophila TaxID=38358 RepID=UPI00187D7CFD|nr:uncharacterized protein LOC119082620 [Bradysia coprophila]